MSIRIFIDGAAGTTPWGVAQTVLSADKKSVFVHLPKLPAMAQLEVPIARTFPLSDAPEALRFLAEGHPGGKIALLP